MADMRHAWRRARHQPGVTLSIILLLALGMGGITAIFNPVYSTLYSPLPFPQPEQLMIIGGGIPLFRIGTGSFDHEEIMGRVFSNMAVWNPEQMQIRVPDTNRQLEVNTLRVSEDFFETLGVKPLIGSDFRRNEHRVGYVVSNRFWRNELMQKTDVVGSYLLSSDGNQLPIIGVMPISFNFPFDTDIWQWVRGGTLWGNPGNTGQYMGRLRPGVSAVQAAEALKTIDTSLTVDVVMGNVRLSGSGPILQPLQTYLYGNKRPMLRMLGAAAILFLLLACAGVVNLLIAQGVKRKQEIVTRLIYGASRRNLVFQMLRETLPLVAAGGLAGLWLSEMVSAWMLAQMPELRGGAVDVPVKIAFWAVLVMVATLIGGLIPSLYATSLDLNTYLKAATGVGKRKLFSTQELLVGAQLSLSLALLIGVGVLIRSIMFNVDIPIGWSSRDIAVVSIINTVVGGTGSRTMAINHDIQNELRAMPEVISVGIVSPIPYSARAIRGAAILSPVYKELPDRYKVQIGETGDAAFSSVTINPDAFNLLGIPLVLGRYFTEADIENAIQRRDGDGTLAATAILNQAAAERLWPGENPIGNTFHTRSGTNPSREVVGVVRNIHHFPGNRDFVPVMYIPRIDGTVTGAKIEILVKLRPNASFQNFHANARQRLSGFPLDWIEIEPLSEYVKDATMNQRLTLRLLFGFAVLGIIVSGLAVYATATLAAKSRTKETGIRMAMGAQTWDILKLAFWRGIRAILIGLPFGLFMAWILARVLSGYLVQVNIGDTFTWLISCAILLVIAAVAALIPALRSSRVNPIDALRDE